MIYQSTYKYIFCSQSKDVDEKLHHSGKFFIKLHSTTGSKLTKYYLTYDEGKILSVRLKHRVRSTRYAAYYMQYKFLLIFRDFSSGGRM